MAEPSTPGDLPNTILDSELTPNAVVVAETDPGGAGEKVGQLRLARGGAAIALTASGAGQIPQPATSITAPLALIWTPVPRFTEEEYASGGFSTHIDGVDDYIQCPNVTARIRVKWQMGWNYNDAQDAGVFPAAQIAGPLPIDTYPQQIIQSSRAAGSTNGLSDWHNASGEGTVDIVAGSAPEERRIRLAYLNIVTPMALTPWALRLEARFDS